MILVKHKELLFTNREQYIAAVGDQNAAVRVFRLERETIDGVDLADLSFRLNAELPDRTPDTAYLEKEVRCDAILLTWEISGAITAQAGTSFINLRAFDDNGTVRWASFQAPVYVEGITSQPTTGLSELEQLERSIDKKLRNISDQEKGRQEAEQKRQEAEKQRAAAEKEREKKTDEVIETFEEKISEAGRKAAAAEGSAKEAEAWAHGRADFPAQATDNSKYWKERAYEEYLNAKNEADRASAYADFVEPDFILEDNRIYWNDRSTVDFKVERNKMYMKLPTAERRV